MSRVYITNRSGHDYSDAYRFGTEIVFLSEGRISALAVNKIYRDLAEKLKDSTSKDFIVITSLPLLSAIACSILAYKHGRLNILVFKDGRYIERNIKIAELL
jgi:hypothetical protein